MRINIPPRNVDHTNQKGTLVSPGAHWFPQSPTIVRITSTTSTTTTTSYSILVVSLLTILDPRACVIVLLKAMSDHNDNK